MRKLFYLIIGCIALGLGTLGVILPILPTTPFLLLASFCFVRGSERFNCWFISTSLYKKHLEDFVNHRTMTQKQKLFIPGLVSLMMLIPFILVDNLIMRMSLILIVSIKWYYFIFRIKTKSN